MSSPMHFQHMMGAAILQQVYRTLFSQLAAIFLLPTALLSTPSTLSHTQPAVTFLPLIRSCHIYSWTITGPGIPSSIHVLWVTKLLLFRDLREDLHHIHRRRTGAPFVIPRLKTGEQKEKEKEGKGGSGGLIWKKPYPAMLWKRFWWVFKLPFSMRYIGWEAWDTGDTGIKPEVPVRTGFRIVWLARKVIFVAILFAVLDLARNYQHGTALFVVARGQNYLERPRG